MSHQQFHYMSAEVGRVIDPLRVLDARHDVQMQVAALVERAQPKQVALVQARGISRCKDIDAAVAIECKQLRHPRLNDAILRGRKAVHSIQ